MIKEFLKSLTDVTNMVYLLLITLDILLAVGIAVRNSKFSAQQLVSGIVRKVSAIVSLIVFAGIDFIVGIDLSYMIPNSWVEKGNIQHVGLATIFALAYIIHEFGSLLKNMRTVGLPVQIGRASCRERV